MKDDAVIQLKVRSFGARLFFVSWGVKKSTALSGLTGILLIFFLSIFWAVNINATTKAAHETDRFVFLIDNARHLERAEKILLSARVKLIKLLDDSLTYRPEVHIVDKVQDFSQLAGGKLPDWGAAVAFPERRLIVVKSPDHFNLSKSLEELLAHEYAHLAVAHKAGFGRPPRWFDEGTAMYVSMEWDWADNIAMNNASLFGQFIPLEAIELVNRFGGSKAEVAYAESYLAVEYLLDNYGKKSLQRFLDKLYRGGTAEEALYETTGLTYLEFERDFREHLNSRFNIVNLLVDTWFFWLGLAVLLVIGAIMQFRRRKKYEKKWEEREKLESTDFDYGNADEPEETDDEDEPWRG